MPPRRAFSTACLMLFLAAPAAWAGNVSGELAFCEGGDFCRYFPEPRLEVTFLAREGERNDLRMLADPGGVRIADTGAPIEVGAYCTSVDPNDAVCGPPAPSGLLAAAFTGDGPDAAFARTGSVFLGLGRDHGLAAGTSMDGGPGSDTLIGVSGASLLTGGAGHDRLSGAGGGEALGGGSGKDLIAGGAGADGIEAGSGADFVAGGPGRDQIYAGSGDDLIHATDSDRDIVRCGRGNDRAFISVNDRAFGCERVIDGSHG
jgi:RTX calcium-binding nonapeptide repeat (4 copies)